MFEPSHLQHLQRTLTLTSPIMRKLTFLATLLLLMTACTNDIPQHPEDLDSKFPALLELGLNQAEENAPVHFSISNINSLT